MVFTPDVTFIVLPIVHAKGLLKMSTLDRPGPADVAKEIPPKGFICDNRTDSLFHV